MKIKHYREHDGNGDIKNYGGVTIGYKITNPKALKTTGGSTMFQFNVAICHPHDIFVRSVGVNRIDIGYFENSVRITSRAVRQHGGVDKAARQIIDNYLTSVYGIGIDVDGSEMYRLWG